jgi:hypothetical protein
MDKYGLNRFARALAVKMSLKRHLLILHFKGLAMKFSSAISALFDLLFIGQNQEQGTSIKLPHLPMHRNRIEH